MNTWNEKECVNGLNAAALPNSSFTINNRKLTNGSATVLRERHTAIKKELELG